MNYWISSSATIIMALCIPLGCKKEVVQEKEIIRPVRAVKVGDLSDFKTQWFTGVAAATQSVNLAFEVPGIVIEKRVTKGDKVKKGDILARLDDRDFVNDLNAAKAAKKRANVQLDRIKVALKTNAVSQQDLSDAQAVYDQKNAVVNIKAKAVDDTAIIAPYDGVIAATYIDNYQRIQAKQDAIRLVDISKIEFDVDIPESLIAMVPKPSSKITSYCRFTALGSQEFPAHIKSVGTEASEATLTYPVTLIISQPEGVEILPGMAGEVRGAPDLVVSKIKEALTVPMASIFESDGQSSVWVIDEKTNLVSRKPIEIVRLSAYGALVKGITAGQWVATAGVHYLKESQKVTILASNAAGGKK